MFNLSVDRNKGNLLYLLRGGYLVKVLVLVTEALEGGRAGGLGHTGGS